MLSAIESNERKIIGRKYFLDLINDNKNFKPLMDAIKGPEKEQLLEYIKQLENPNSYYQQIVSFAQYSTSWLTIVPTSILRYGALNIVNAAAAISPDTLDSACKRGLRNLAQAHLDEFEPALNKAEQNVEDLSEKIANENRELKERIVKSDIATLTSTSVILSQTSDVKAKALAEFRELYITVMNQREELQKAQQRIKGADTALEAINKLVETHDDFAVRLSNFLARIFSFFKTETATTIDNAIADANKLRKEMSDLQEQYKAYEKDVSKVVEGLRNNQNIPAGVKDDLAQQLANTGSVERPSEPIDKSLVQSVADSKRASDAYKLICSNFMFFHSPQETRPKQQEREVQEDNNASDADDEAGVSYSA